MFTTGFRKRAARLAGVSIALTAGAAGIAFAAQAMTATTTTANVINACQLKNLGTIRIVTDPRHCNATLEAAISWNVQGSKGDPGATGPAGTTGAVGPKGETGATGPAGVAGASGAGGVAGPEGATGATGAVGADGPAGPAGPKGADGKDGTNGTNGSDGAPGPKGDPGPAGKDGRGEAWFAATVPYNTYQDVVTVPGLGTVRAYCGGSQAGMYFTQDPSVAFGHAPVSDMPQNVPPGRASGNGWAARNDPANTKILAAIKLAFYWVAVPGSSANGTGPCDFYVNYTTSS